MDFNVYRFREAEGIYFMEVRRIRFNGKYGYRAYYLNDQGRCLKFTKRYIDKDMELK